MTDGTDALNTPAAAQPATDAAGAGIEQANGAAATPETSEPQVWQAPEGFDEHLGKALSKLPAEQREVFLSLESDGLNNVRDLVLKGVDYTQKRQKEAGELRDMKARMAQMEADAAAWAEAKSDPLRASKMFQAYATGGVDAAATQEPQVDFNDIWDATDPDTARQKAELWAKGLKDSIRQELLQEQANSPASRQQAAQQTLNQMRQGVASGLDDAGWARALESVQKTLDRERVDYRSLSPEQLRLVISPAIDYELRSASTSVAGLNPSALTGNQAASMRGAGGAAARPTFKKPGADASVEEKLEWLAKSQGKSLSELYG